MLQRNKSEDGVEIALEGIGNCIELEDGMEWRNNHKRIVGRAKHIVDSLQNRLL